MSAAVSLAEVRTSSALGPGLHHAVPSSVYHTRELGMVSNSALHRLAKSPLHYKAWADGVSEDEETAVLWFGTAFHCGLLEPERFARAYAVEPEFGDCRKKENKATRDAWRAANASAESMSETDAKRVTGMVAAVRAHPLAGKMIRDGDAELTVRWTDPDTGLQCKSRADYYVRRHGMVLDVKSTEDASPKGFQRSIINYKYGWQYALYRAGFATIGEAAKHFVFVAVEKEPPHAIGIYTLDDKWVAHSHNEVRELIRLLSDCLTTDIWPGYPCTIRTLDLPPWLAAS